VEGAVWQKVPQGCYEISPNQTTQNIQHSTPKHETTMVKGRSKTKAETPQLMK
jgi:hypothetical protein